jgi:HAL2 family 3'(2'),5'-bisphosphate nucleotidase
MGFYGGKKFRLRMVLPVLLGSFLSEPVLAFYTPTITKLASRCAATRPSLMTTQMVDYDELPADFPRRKDVLVGLEAVRKAATMTQALQPESSDGIGVINKQDASPVTVADFAAQAMILRHLKDAFPDDSFIAEESSAALADDAGLANQVLKASQLGDMDALKESIDLGKEYEHWDGSSRPTRVWCLDPIDGTKGFLRGRRDGGQYAVALALLESGTPTIGILGCPNLPSDPKDFSYVWQKDENLENNQQTRGCIFVASKDGGSFQLPILPKSSSSIRLHVTPNDGSTMATSEARFCIGVEKFSDALGQCCAVMAKVLHGEEGLDDDGSIVKARRIDSQAKYGIIARAGAEYYARLPAPGYVEWIWDHAAGKVVVEEAGGSITDTKGKVIDFSLGAKMSDSVHGVLASSGGVFQSALLNAFIEQEAERQAKNADMNQFQKKHL